MPEGFVFVLEDGSGRPSRKDMTLVHSHSMKGRNVRINSRRWKQREKRAREATMLFREEVISRAPPSDLECVQFATKIDDRSRQALFKVLAISATSNLLYPVERCIDLHNAQDYVRWLSQDAGFVHITLFTTCAIDDFMQHQAPTTLTLQYLRQSLVYVNSKLSEHEGYKLDTIIVVVMTLAFMGTMFEDLDAASAHIKGLQRLVQLRGGHQYLMKNPKIYFKIERIELSWCLSTGQVPVFYRSPVSWQPFFRGSQPAPSGLCDILSIDIATWPKLAGVYKDLQYLSNLINKNDIHGTMMDAESFQNAVHSIQSRLLALQGDNRGGIGECMRLGMLAVLTTTFRMPSRKMPHAYLASRLRATLETTSATTPGSRMVLTWVLLMSIVAVFEANESWISHLWCTLVRQQKWEAMEAMMEQLIWIRCIHDEPGNQAFMQLERSRHVVVHGI
ncbi:hypothetical protein P154DRAFT_486527 [Amniculicola lignicola CBS 123094]|uniref:Transcription factor domain-containing protein n=1 Tax=Amniculicola lignicola CBS 123094 TaxID=1392246 RepID=A0A6A5WUA4_9PLEO|nr:hypothetical protein P154DRAFT_486527 [Amniculicola lignicola CBS 123094]